MPISFIGNLLVSCVMNGLVIRKLEKVARLWYKNFISPNEEIIPCESSFPCLKHSAVVVVGREWPLFQLPFLNLQLCCG